MPAPFEIDPHSLYDVASDGTPRTDHGVPPIWLDARHRRVLGWVALGAGTTGALAALTILCFAFGVRLAAAGFALATLAATPLLAVGPALDWWLHRRPLRQRHATRPASFPPA